MSILIRTGRDQWQEVERSEFLSESELQKLLHHSPELIPLRTDGAFAIFLREVHLSGTGYVDLLGIGSDGSILIVETKLARNDEIRRKVIGQILEYAAHLWNVSFDELDTLFKVHHGSSLAEVFADRGIGAEDFELLRSAVQENLASGTFVLYVIVDEMSPTLERILSFMSSRVSGIRVEALSLGRYAHNGTEVIIPKRFGNKQPGTNAPVGRATEASMLDGAEDDHARKLIKLALSQWSGGALQVRMGSAGTSMTVRVGNEVHPVFWLFSNEVVLLFFGMLRRGAPEAVVQSFRSGLLAIGGLSDPRFQTATKPSAKLASLTESDFLAFLKLAKDAAELWVKSKG
jgi:hypothetical protein